MVGTFSVHCTVVASPNVSLKKNFPIFLMIDRGFAFSPSFTTESIGLKFLKSLGQIFAAFGKSPKSWLKILIFQLLRSRLIVPAMILLCGKTLLKLQIDSYALATWLKTSSVFLILS